MKKTVTQTEHGDASSLSDSQKDASVLDGSTDAVKGNTGNYLQEHPEGMPASSAANRNTTVNAIFELTDEGNARRIVHYYGHEIRYCQDMGVWFVWAKTRWTQYAHTMEQEIAKKVSSHIMEEAEDLPSHRDREKYRKWASQSQQKKHLDAMLELAKSQPELVIQSSQLDSDPNLLNVENGTLNLVTGELHPHNPTHLITRTTGRDYDPEAECPLWEEFVKLIMGLDEEKVKDLQRLMGLSLSGHPGPKVIYCFGPRGTGLTDFLAIIVVLLREYAKIAPEGMLDVRNHKYIRSALGDLRGARVVLSHGSRKSKPLDETQMKVLPTKKRILAHASSGKRFTFAPTHKLWIGGEHAPVIEDVDRVWRDAHVVEFSSVLSKEERRIFALDQLLGELRGILNWAIRGLQGLAD